MITRYNSDADKVTREYVAYVEYMLKCVSDKSFEEIRLILEGCFNGQELSDYRLASSDLVRLKDAMDERMRKYRESHLTNVEGDKPNALAP